MYEMFSNDTTRPLPERKAWMILSHVPSVHGMRIDSIERCTFDGVHHEVVIKSDGALYRIRTERDYSSPSVEKQEIRLPQRRQVKEAPRHSALYERLSTQLFPSLA